MTETVKSQVGLLCKSLLDTTSFNLAALQKLTDSLQHLDEQDEISLLEFQAYAFYYAGHDEQAYKSFNALAALRPSANAFTKMAQVELRRSKALSALQLSEAALQLSPDHPLALIVKASALLILGRHDEAKSVTIKNVESGGDARTALVKKLLSVDSNNFAANQSIDELTALTASAIAGTFQTLTFSDTVTMVARMEALANTNNAG
ncbi:hypothetical protein [Pseudomonas sp. COR18]|uniref:hypothetical protein n=1 Tax=Pseudomonas sp. COR18 TaxID=3399680 RepID=UPI003B00CDFA